MGIVQHDPNSLVRQVGTPSRNDGFEAPLK